MREVLFILSSRNYDF